MNPTLNGEVTHFLQTTLSQLREHLRGLLLFARDNFGHFLWRLLGIFVIFFAARLVLKWVGGFTARVMKHKRASLSEEHSRRVDTLMTLAHSAARYGIYFVALLLVLGQFGPELSKNLLLAVGSFGGIALGLGAQDMVKDVIAGLFMIFENQFSVGDYIQTEEATGTVEAIALRVTYLRSPKGDQIIVPNGSIQRVINYNRGSYVAVITVPTVYENDTRRVIAVMEEALTAYGEAHRDLLEELPVVRGVDTLGSATVDISAACRVNPMMQWEVERGMRLAVKEAFDRHGIRHPYPRVVAIPGAEEAPLLPEEPPAAPSRDPKTIPEDQEEDE